MNVLHRYIDRGQAKPPIAPNTPARRGGLRTKSGNVRDFGAMPDIVAPQCQRQAKARCPDQPDSTLPARPGLARAFVTGRERVPVWAQGAERRQSPARLITAPNPVNTGQGPPHDEGRPFALQSGPFVTGRIGKMARLYRLARACRIHATHSNSKWSHVFLRKTGSQFCATYSNIRSGTHHPNHRPSLPAMRRNPGSRSGVCPRSRSTPPCAGPTPAD
jgi:hypothetical protein